MPQIQKEYIGEPDKKRETYNTQKHGPGILKFEIKSAQEQMKQNKRILIEMLSALEKFWVDKIMELINHK